MSREVARGILENFEISPVVLLPNATTSHAITYTNWPLKFNCSCYLVKYNISSNEEDK